MSRRERAIEAAARPCQYGPVSRFFHWLVAGLLAFQVPLAYVMIEQPLSPAKLGNYALHKSVGLTIFTLMALRLAWKLLMPGPVLPPELPRWQRLTARLTQGLLYVVLLLMPLTGWLNSSAANIPVSFFSLFTLPNLVAPDEALQQSFEAAHRAQSYLLFTLASLHVAAALWHHFVRKDDVLRTMLPFSDARS